MRNYLRGERNLEKKNEFNRENFLRKRLSSSRPFTFIKVVRNFQSYLAIHFCYPLTNLTNLLLNKFCFFDHSTPSRNLHIWRIFSGLLNLYRTKKNSRKLFNYAQVKNSQQLARSRLPEKCF